MNRRGLYAITPENGDIVRRTALALEGGVALLQFRSKQGDRALAAEIARLARRHGVSLIVNDDVELALEIDAAGAHLGRDEGDLAHARKKLAGRILGVSCYGDPALASAAVAAGADYIAFGSVFASPTKPSAIRAPLELFNRKFGVPVAAIGGITLENAPAVIAAGADLLAVISDVFDAPDIRLRASQYGRLFQ